MTPGAGAGEREGARGKFGQKAHPTNADAATKADVSRWLDDLVGNQRPTYALLFAAVGCVLLIACANVANLLLARFVGRRKEIALRFALGASRRHVIRQLLLESMLIALAGGAVSLLVAQWGLSAFTRVGQAFIPRSLEISLDPRALLFTFGAALLTGLAMGLIPALQAANQDANDALKDSSRGSTGGAAQGRLRSSLLVGEIALSLVLLIAASLLLTSFARLQRVSPGFNPEGVFVGFIAVPPTKYPPPVALANFYLRITERLAAIPWRTVPSHSPTPCPSAAAMVPRPSPSSAGPSSRWVTAPMPCGTSCRPTVLRRSASR